MPYVLSALPRCLCSLILLCLLCACQTGVPDIPRDLRDNSAALPTVESLQQTIVSLVDGGGNLGRLTALEERIAAKDLTPYLTSQQIDWYSLQKNLMVEIPGTSKNIIYFVAHYDKSGANPLSFVSLMLNGAFDTVLSPLYSSDGALDNATGVSAVLELAHSRSRQENHYTYRFLFVGAEEVGLRGSRVHVANLSEEERAAIEFTVNIDTIGVKGGKNCLTTGVSDPFLSYLANAAAEALGYTLERDLYPMTATSDYLPFQKTGFATDFSYGLQFNLVGGLMPQRSWFTKPAGVPVMNFRSCDMKEDSTNFVSNFLLPVGELHGYRDNIDMVDIGQIYELYRIVGRMIDQLERQAAERGPNYRTARSGATTLKPPVSEN